MDLHPARSHLTHTTADISLRHLKIQNDTVLLLKQFQSPNFLKYMKIPKLNHIPQLLFFILNKLTKGPSIQLDACNK